MGKLFGIFLIVFIGCGGDSKSGDGGNAADAAVTEDASTAPFCGDGEVNTDDEICDEETIVCDDECQPVTVDLYDTFLAMGLRGAGFQIAQLSPDGRWLVLVSRFRDPDDQNRETDMVVSVPMEGGDPIVLYPPTVSLDNFYFINGAGLHIAPNSERVVFVGGPLDGPNNRLWSVPIDGSAEATAISGPVASDAHQVDHNSISMSPDSQHAAFMADLEHDEVDQAYVAPLDGSAGPTLLSNNNTSDSLADVVGPVRFLPNGKIRYAGDLETGQDGREYIYDNTVAGDDQSLVLAGADVTDSDQFDISPDGYDYQAWADADVVKVQLSATQARLYAVPKDGSSPVVLTPGDNLGGVKATLSKDGDSVTFLEAKLGQQDFRLRHATFDGNTYQTLSADPVDSLAHHAESSDGSHVAYVSAEMDTDQYEVFWIGTDGTGKTRLYDVDAAQDQQWPELLGISGSGSHVIVRGLNNDQILYSLSTDGSGSEVVTSALWGWDVFGIEPERQLEPTNIEWLADEWFIMGRGRTSTELMVYNATDPSASIDLGQTDIQTYEIFMRAGNTLLVEQSGPGISEWKLMRLYQFD